MSDQNPIPPWNRLLVGKSDAADMLGISQNALTRGVKAGRVPGPADSTGHPKWRVEDLRAHKDRPPLPRERMPRSVPLGPGRHHLYRHFDAAGTLLYVGISYSALHRMAEHKQMSHWFWSIARVEVVAYKTREIAMRAEQIAIRNERPLHNVVHSIREAA